MTLDINSDQIYSNFKNDEIDLGYLFNIFWRNKKLVATISFIFFFLTLLIGKFQKKDMDWSI